MSTASGWPIGMATAARPRRVLPRPPPRARTGNGGAGGFTLLEMGLVIAILGLLAYLIADFHVNQLKLRAAERRIDGVVRDVRSIVDASLAWAATSPEGRWPHDLLKNREIDIALLRDDGLLAVLPSNRYLRCPGRNPGQDDEDQCQPYTLIGWDRGDPGRDGGYRSAYHPTAGDPRNPEDLVIRFTMPGTHALAVAAQLPQGAAQLEAPAVPDIYRVEARVLQGGSTRFVLLNNEGRSLIFSPSPDAIDAGSIYNVKSISGGGPENPDAVFLGFDPDDGLQVEKGHLEVVGGNLIVGGSITMGGCPLKCP